MQDIKATGTATKSKSGSGAVRILLILFTAGILTLGALTGYKIFAVGSSSMGKENTVKRNYVVLADAEAVLPLDEDEVNSASSYDVKMNSEWTFANGSAFSEDAYVENPSTNLNSVLNQGYFCRQPEG